MGGEVPDFQPDLKSPLQTFRRPVCYNSAMRAASAALHSNGKRRDVYEKAEAQLGDTARCEEDVLSYIAFPQVAEKFFEQRREAEEKKVRYSIEQL